MKMSMSEQDSKISSSDNNEEVKEFVSEAVSSSLQEEDSSENERPRVLMIRGDEDDDPGSSSHSEVRSPIDADAEDSPSGSEETDSDRNGLYAPNTTGFPPSRSSLSNIPQLTQQQKTNPFAKAGPSEKPLIAPSRWNTSKSSNWTSTTSSRLIIRPSSLNNSVSSTSSPFMNSTNLDQPFSSSCILRPPKLAATTTVAPATSPSKLPEETKEEETSEAAAASAVQNENVNPVFVPLSCEENGKETGGLTPSPAISASTAPSSSGSDAFVFGCNLHERVTTNSKQESDSAAATLLQTAAAVPIGHSESCSSPTSDELFSTESHDRKRKFDDTPVATGEEEESNVIQIICRLFAFDATTSCWIERGRGQLRLNDREEEKNEMQSRLIIRTKGSLRVMLNTKVWGDMTVEKASDKSVRITAMDNGVLRVFLIMATVNDADMLYNALDWRVRLRKPDNSTNDKDSPIKKKRTAPEEFCNDEGI